MRLFTWVVLASTALVPAAAWAQGAGAQPSAGVPNQGSQARPIAASDIEGREVYTTAGQNVGQVDGVVIGQGNQPYAVISFDDSMGVGGEMRLVPLARMTLQGDRAVIPGARQQFAALPVYRANMAGYRDASPNFQTRMQVMVAQSGTAADGSQIVVRQPAPNVMVDQAAPRVMVRQAQPNVTVRQPQPEILVNQPAPTVRVDIPQPEITVRMPRPDVNVAMAQPQVQVRQPQPQVQVTQPDQPQVKVERAQPQVTLQRQANAQPEVQVQQAPGQPVVRYQRAQPRVIVNQAQGQPNVHIVPMDNQQAAAQPGQQQPNAQSQQQQAQAQIQQQQPAASAATAGMRALDVSELNGMDVAGPNGDDDYGEVTNVLLGPNNKTFLVVSVGGFLGIGDREVAVPLDHFALRGDDTLVMTGYNRTSLAALPAYTKGMAGYRVAGDTTRVNLAPYQTATAAAPAATAAVTPYTAEQRRSLRERLNAGDTESTGAVSAAGGPTRPISVADLENLNVYNARGDELGDVDRVIVTPQGQKYLVVGSGGFLGIGRDRVAFPLNRFWMRGDRLVIRGVTEQDIDTMDNYRSTIDNFQRVSRNDTANLRVWQ